MQENVGLQDMSAFAKTEVSGPGAERWLDSILTNRIPKTPGRVTLTYLLTARGGVRAEFTLTRLGPERFYLVSAGALETHDFDSLEKLLPADGSVRLDKVTTRRGVLVLAGPRSREVLARVADIDVSDKAFPWLTARRLSVRAAALMALRVNFVGELGYELHHPIEMQNYVFDALMEAGAPYGIKPFGIRAMDSLRLEKSYRLVGRELSIEYAALESGLERFVDFDKGPFLGRDALVTWCGKGFENKLVTLEVFGVDRSRRARLRAGDQGWRERSDARPRAVLAGGPASHWRSPWSDPSSRRRGPSSTSACSARHAAPSSSPTAHPIRATRRCGGEGSPSADWRTAGGGLLLVYRH